jgi:hypothetical protein
MNEKICYWGKFGSVLNWLSTIPLRRMGSGGIAPPLLTSALHVGELSASCPGRFTSKKGPLFRYALDRRPCGPQSRAGGYGENKFHAPAGVGTLAIQPITRRYIEWAIPALKIYYYKIKYGGKKFTQIFEVYKWIIHSQVGNTSCNQANWYNVYIQLVNFFCYNFNVFHIDILFYFENISFVSWVI